MRSFRRSGESTWFSGRTTTSDSRGVRRGEVDRSASSASPMWLSSLKVSAWLAPVASARVDLEITVFEPGNHSGRVSNMNYLEVAEQAVHVQPVHVQALVAALALFTNRISCVASSNRANPVLPVGTCNSLWCRAFPVLGPLTARDAPRLRCGLATRLAIPLRTLGDVSQARSSASRSDPTSPSGRPELHRARRESRLWLPQHRTPQKRPA